MTKWTWLPQASGRRFAGFTLLELLVVVLIITIIATLLSAALNQTRAKAHQIACLNNLRHLQLSWSLYTDDNSDLLPLNRSEPSADEQAYGRRNTTNSWVVGNPKEDITTRNVVKGTLFPYTKSAALYRCPADRSQVVGHPLLRTRSYSMSSYLNGDDAGVDPRVKTVSSAVGTPSPDKVFAFIEEHEYSLWMGSFSVSPPEKSIAAIVRWVSLPADRHERGCNLSFVDGHVEYWRWFSSKKLAPYGRPNVNKHELRDLRRLQEGVPRP
ncbi:MAG: prepilin-type N-terminal cleavage/methylation domain-containing protein [Verrucomicrobia bacterium]|nr:prepilin-type N-terminal cleavage/methylation domain-containing protein [Verrucomicrobiota bacterium]